MHRGSDIRALIRRIERAGGTVTTTNKGHLRVVGPLGVAFVNSLLPNPRERHNAITDIRKYAGLEV